MDWGVRMVSLLLCLGVLLATIQHGYAERKIVCYYTNWSIYRPGTAKFSPQNINPYLCTHLIYAFGGFTKDNALKPFDKYQDIEKGGYAKFTGLKTYNKNLKTLLAIGGWNEGSSRFSPMVADAERRREFVKNSIKFLRKNHFDGLDLDWEYPAFRDGGKPRDKDNYASLVQELREEFERESSKTGRPRLLLSMAVPAGIEYIDKGYDVPRLNEYLDFINLLSYDYHSSYEPAVNHHSPLYPLEEDNEYNYDSELTIDYTVSYLLKMGASPDKIILGIPTYGRSYTLFNQDATDLGSPADGPGIEGDATREKGYLAYYEICDSLAASGDWEVVQPNTKAMGPYAFKEDQWVGYDDEDIVKLKAKYANEKELGGIMFWTIDNDDFRGKCHDRPYPLIEAAKEALLSKDTIQRSKTVNSRKKTRLPGVQSNTVGRKLSSGGRRTTTTAAPATRKRVSTPRPKFRTFSRSKASDEEDDDQEVDRRSYEPSNSDEEEESDRGNVVRSVDKADRPRNKGKSRPKTRPNTRSRNKLTRRKNENDDDSDESLSNNKLTTPEPPTTPDPGTDFKCEDEGFFSHPRDCKKYFWCLDSGPGGLGVVAHQFTCPSGLVFNKAADSCDYPRNVVCPKSKVSQSAASTTRAPITAATSRTTYLYSTTRKPSTEKPDLDEEYEEEYDDEEDVEEEEEKAEPKVTSAPKPLLYKTITRSRSTTTTTTTTETPVATTTSKPESSELEKVIGLEDEEDPKVIKELIKLIKKAGGIEQLEKHLSLQNKSPDESSSDKERATPATISRTLYERVLSRQAGKTAGTNFANGPGGAQFEGLDDVPEVKNLRRLQKPQYVTIERPKASTKEPPVEEEEEGAEEELDDDNEDVASSEEQAVSNPFLASSTQRATPNYINIRRARPSATTSRNENDVDEKDEDEEEEVTSHPRRPGLLPRGTESNSSEDTKEQESRSTTSEDNNSPTTKFRYVSVQRFRSTTPRFPVTSETTSSIQEPVTESGSWSETPEFREESEVVTTTPSTTVLPSTTPLTTTPVVLDVETEKEIVAPSPSPEASSTTEAVRLVEDSATEILLTTAAASLSTLSNPSSRAGGASVSQPRPFGFSRRNRPSTEATSSTTPLPSSSEQARPKVSISSRDHTRSSFLGGRGRLRPKPEIADNDQLQPPRATTEEPLPRPSRPRQRGTSRYTPPTFKPKTEPPSNPAIRERARTTEPPGTIDSTPEPPRRRFRRPVSRAASEPTKSNELEDSPIVRITQGPPRNTFVSRSRSAVKDEEDGDDKITNIRVFKKPSPVNRDIYARTRYTKKRNNLETEEPRKDTLAYSSTTASGITLLETSDLTTADRPSREPATEQPRANSVDEEHSASTRSTVATDAQITATDLEDEVTTTESFLENEVVTVTPDGGVDQGLVTTNSVTVEDFDPNVIRIMFPSNGTDSTVQENRNVAVPRRRKVLLRKRPVASNSTASQEEEEEDKLVSRRRKVIRRLRPVQNGTTETTVDISSTEEDQIVLKFGSTSPKQEDTTNLDLSTESFDESTAGTSRTIDYDGIANDFAGATLETPTAETAIDSEELSDPDAITMASTIIDSFTGESSTETSTVESTTSTSLFNSADTNNVLDETSTPSDQTETLTTTMPSTTASTVATQSNRRLEPYDRTYYLDSRYVRKKFVRRRPIDFAENVTSRYPASRSLIRVSSTTENSNLEGLSKRRKGLFVRRRPVSSTTTTTTTTTQVAENKGGKLSDERDLELEDQIDSEDATLRMNRAHDETLFTVDLPAKSDSDEFWSHYTTATPTSRGDLAPLTPRAEIFIEEHSTPASNRRPDFRPRYRVPESLKKTVSTETTYPFDSSPDETGETNDSKLKYHNFRQPRTRYKYRDEVGEEKDEGNEESVLEDATESPSFEFSSQLRTRFYARRPVSSTEPPVTETLVPARKFDYVADAHRRQQSLRTTPRMLNEDSTTLRSPSEEIQNLVDAEYTTTIPPKPQVASSEAIRLPTLKELIGPRTNGFTSPSPVHLSLLPFNAYNEILPRDKHANLFLQGENSRGSSRDREPWSLSDGDQSNEKRDELDLIGGKASEYYAEDNGIPGDEGNALSSKRRIDREDSSTTTLKPTTMRGTPLINLRQNQSTRGFYVTKSEEELLTAGKTDSDSATEFTTVLVETREQGEASTQVATTLEASTVYRNVSDNDGTSSATTMRYTDTTVAPSIADYKVTQITRNEGETESRARSTIPPRDQEQTEVENGLEETTTAFPPILTTVTIASSLEISTTVSVTLRPPTNSIPEVTSTFTPPTDYKPSTTKLLNETLSRTEEEPSTTDIPVTTTVLSNNITDSSTIESTSVPPLTTISDSTLTISAFTDMQFDSSAKTPYSSPPTETMEPVTEAGRQTQRVAFIDLGTMSTVEEHAESSEATRAALEENTVTQGDEGKRNVTSDSTTLTSITKHVPSTTEESTEAPVTKSSRRRSKFGERSVIRTPIRQGWKQTTVDQGDRANQVEKKTPLPLHRVAIYRGRRRRPVATSTAASNATVPQASSTFNQLARNVSAASASEEDRDREKGKRLEVNSTKSSVASTRTAGSALWTRLRKPAAFSSSSSHSTSTTVASYRKNRPSEGNSSTVNEKPDATDEVRGAPKAEKESDQSGRAQEIAVTLAEPPTPRPPATGRPSFRNPLRRRISTTLAPRTDATTSRGTPRDRQKPRASVQQNVTSRPRRPPVIDYDYYEDEEEPVVGKSSFNGKLFLTSKGTFRCLDQGNFPHPYSCKKFITCARMVNGLVIGAEYSCPDKLSFDPVGGICNWSAGLGCKD